MSISQRQCRFSYEAETLTSSPVYSFSICRNECRLKFALKTCKCIPHFYRPTGLTITFTAHELDLVYQFFSAKNGDKYNVCGFDGIQCLIQHKGTWYAKSSSKLNLISVSDELISLKETSKQCRCLANCDDSIFFVKSYVKKSILFHLIR